MGKIKPIRCRSFLVCTLLCVVQPLQCSISMHMQVKIKVCEREKLAGIKVTNVAGGSSHQLSLINVINQVT